MENIDKVYYINLDKRVDRRIDIEKECAEHFDNTMCIERFPAIKIDGQGLLGCSMSHLEVIKKARKLNEKYIIVFEDDFQFLVSKQIFTENIKKLFNDVNTNNFDFKVIMLSYNANNRTKYNDYLDSTTDVQTCSGYLVNGKYFDELIECWEEGVNLYKLTGKDWIYCCDQYWKRLQKNKWYLYTTRIGKQKAGFSDCGNRYLDYNC